MGKIPPCGARGRCPFLSDQKGTKESPGDGSDERLRGAGAHSRLSPGPPVYGSGSLWLVLNFRRAKSRFVSVLLSAHRGLLPSKFKGIATLTHAAWCVPTCWVRRWSGGYFPQLPSCQGFARAGGVISTQDAANSSLGRPQWAGARRTKQSCLCPPDSISNLSGGRPP